MPTIKRTRLLRASVLREMKPSTVADLLRPHGAYLKKRGLAVDDIGQPDYCFDELAAVLASPSDCTPPNLIEQLELLDLISGGQSTLNFEAEYQQLVERVREEDDTPADLAVKILLAAPEIALREFDRQVLQARRSLVSFKVAPGMPFQGVSPDSLARFKSVTVPWFEANARTATCQIHPLESEDGWSFVVRHGDLLKRIGVLDPSGNQDSCILRPERVDVAHYHVASGEWQIAGLGLKLQELYRQAYGAAFHGSASALFHSQRYSLEPLREGPAVLACDLSQNIQFVELKSLKFQLPGGQQVAVNRPPVFEALEQLNPSLLAHAPLLEATLIFKVAARQRRMQVRICPERDTVAGDAGLPVIDGWLLERGFANDHADRILASA